MCSNLIIFILVLRTVEEDKEKLKKISELDSLILFGLLANEHRMSAIHFVMKRSPGFEEELKNKSELTFISGFRRFKCKPIFSQHTNGNKVRIFADPVSLGSYFSTKWNVLCQLTKHG